MLAGYGNGSHMSTNFERLSSCKSTVTVRNPVSCTEAGARNLRRTQQFTRALVKFDVSTCPATCKRLSSAAPYQR